jgi:hypothetical protein
VLIPPVDAEKQFRASRKTYKRKDLISEEELNGE